MRFRDNADAGFPLSMLLKLKGYEVHTRHSGRSAVEAAEPLRPRAIVLDLDMPDLDGYETCQAIHQQTLGQEVILIA